MLFAQSIRLTVPDETEVAPIITPCKDLRHGDYQWYDNILSSCHWIPLHFVALVSCVRFLWFIVIKD